MLVPPLLERAAGVDELRHECGGTGGVRPVRLAGELDPPVIGDDVQSHLAPHPPRADVHVVVADVLRWAVVALRPALDGVLDYQPGGSSAEAIARTSAAHLEKIAGTRMPVEIVEFLAL